MATASSFTALPTEILEAIFLHLDPRALIAVSQTSKHNNKITIESPVIWRHFCRTRFRFWDSHHDIAAKFSGPLSNVDWRRLFALRIGIEKKTLRLLNKVLESQQGRIRYINEIADFGDDARETLLDQYKCPDDTEDVLARRYYTNAILERIRREKAIHLWKDLASGADISMEKALGAYDLFARSGEDVDLDIISADLDRLAQELLQQHAGFADCSTRRKAEMLGWFLQERGFQGASDLEYSALRNSFIGLVLRSPDHQSLPLVSVAIYCAVARRVGVDARPCGFLFHVYCLVYAPKNYLVDGEYKPTSSTELDFIYIDPFHASTEVNPADLKTKLRESGVPGIDHEAFLSDTNTREMVLRTARNIMNSVQSIRQREAGIYNRGPHHGWLDAYPDMDNAFYATLWAMLILGPSEDTLGTLSSVHTRRRQYLPYILEHFQTHFPWDVTLLEQHVTPLFRNQPEGQRLLEFVQSMHNLDGMRKPVSARNTPPAQKVRYKVGQLFKHKRYHYEGVITGWDTSCDAGEEWIQHMGVDRLRGGRNQSFYHVMVCDKSVRYVAEENITPAIGRSAEPSEAMLRLAGRHFKRWDAESYVFVSNIRDEYPED
ncbi:Hemimethylated DNA-binding protein YccV like-domain-containing protein [Clohesyomyces aquaticus]|uniref:Hemimethylated DNA-binding protein YccV like-domain-containing protein n=1 Tax=Clohesyomyces aquaticus TaxID=1231657 RepID=A0A1Y2A1J5_9PLEO|nr:Hemimethylated DNA-binding protein YccV like-domain-containing protein [Clohesyomyces aquaticus]